LLVLGVKQIVLSASLRQWLLVHEALPLGHPKRLGNPLAVV
jgi:hypothetical protein